MCMKKLQLTRQGCTDLAVPPAPPTLPLASTISFPAACKILATLTCWPFSSLAQSRAVWPIFDEDTKWPHRNHEPLSCTSIMQGNPSTSQPYVLAPALLRSHLIRVVRSRSQQGLGLLEVITLPAGLNEARGSSLQVMANGGCDVECKHSALGHGGMGAVREARERENRRGTKRGIKGGEGSSGKGGRKEGGPGVKKGR